MIGQPPIVGDSPVSQATATGTTTTGSGTDVLLASMAVTPGAGRYLAIFTSSFDHGTNNQSVFVSLYVNGVQVAHTERGFRRGGGGGDNAGGLAIQAELTGVLAAQVVDVRWRTPGGTASAYERTLTLVRIGD